MFPVCTKIAWLRIVGNQEKIYALQILNRVERSGNADREFFQTSLDDAGRRHGVLLLQARDDLVAADTEPGELMGIEFEIEFLVLGSDQLRLRCILYSQDLRTNSLDVVAQLALYETIGCKGIDNAEDIAKLVIEWGPRRLAE